MFSLFIPGLCVVFHSNVRTCPFSHLSPKPIPCILSRQTSPFYHPFFGFQQKAKTATAALLSWRMRGFNLCRSFKVVWQFPPWFFPHGSLQAWVGPKSHWFLSSTLLSVSAVTVFLECFQHEFSLCWFIDIIPHGLGFSEIHGNISLSFYQSCNGLFLLHLPYLLLFFLLLHNSSF